LKRLEQEGALERERTRIAQDLHDEMGAKLCRISFLSEHARRGNTEPAELQNQIASISDAARDVLHSLDEIVWAVNPQNDTLEHVASYLGQYAQDYFQLTGIECEVDMPAQLPAYSVSSQARHHLFLAVHEAFTNILKHSRATRAKVSISFNDSAFHIRVVDNGSGGELHSAKANGDELAPASGNGLVNMRQRMADIGGDCQIEFKVGQGASIHFIFPLNMEKSQPL
jgi:signal transduction histidine kinase